MESKQKIMKILEKNQKTLDSIFQVLINTRY